MSHLANMLLGYIQLGTTSNTPFLPPNKCTTWLHTIRYNFEYSFSATYLVCYMVPYNQVQHRIELLICHLSSMLLGYLQLGTIAHRTIYVPPNQYATRLPTFKYNIAQNYLSPTYITNILLDYLQLGTTLHRTPYLTPIYKERTLQPAATANNFFRQFVTEKELVLIPASHAKIESQVCSVTRFCKNSLFWQIFKVVRCLVLGNILTHFGKF